MTLKIEGCCDYEADIRLFSNPTTSAYGKINGKKVCSWNGNKLNKRANFVNNSSKYAFYLLAIAAVATIAGVVSIPYSFPATLCCGGAAVLGIAGVAILKKINAYVIQELKKQYALNAQAYLYGGPIGAFKRKCELGTFKNFEDFEMMNHSRDLEIALAVDKAFEAVQYKSNGEFKDRFITSLKRQQERYEEMREQNRQLLEDLVVSWFQGKRVNDDLDRYCDLQGRSWSVPQIIVP